MGTSDMNKSSPPAQNRKRSLSSSPPPSSLLHPGDNANDGDSTYTSQYRGGGDNDNGVNHISQPVVRSDSEVIDSLENEDDDDEGGLATSPVVKLAEQHLTIGKEDKAVKKHKRSGSGMTSSREVTALSAPSSANTNSSWKDFCRQGDRFKALLDNAMVKVGAATAAAKSSNDGFTTENQHNDKHRSSSYDTVAISSHSLLEKLAQEKEIENIHLQQKLEQEQTETATLRALLEDLQSAKEQHVCQISRLTTALKQAAQTATQAREDADLAEQKVVTLATKVDALETVVQETKRASQQLMQEQDQAHQSVRIVEAKFIQAQTDLARSNVSNRKIQQEYRAMKRHFKQIQQRLADTTNELEQEKEDKKSWKRQASELEVISKLQQERLERLEKELQKSKSLLIDATSAASESQQTKQKVQSSLERIEETNRQLSDSIQENQKQLNRQEELHSKALAQARKDHQATQHKWSRDRDLVQSLKIEKQAADKKISQLQGKLAQVERRLLDSTNLASSNSLSQDEFAISRGNQNDSISINGNGFQIPSLSYSKENPTSNMSKGVCQCSICNKQGTGIMRKCQCGNNSCTLRAHPSCFHRVTMQKATTSVSHPGTPAPKLPVLLCSNNTKTTLDGCNGKTSSAATAVTPATSMVNRKDVNHRSSF
ncbi:hypothetical protein IV203_033809 [Nitzschia inconspicua]|uniref:Uncharacterized protein n=1 Tax=Nitzschia inconspicua TaxID=303405 RepID=A0A9K3M318_9STRA|nr:hypothetical protein IV203_033809 [Nitzschia inconspicua]